MLDPECEATRLKDMSSESSTPPRPKFLPSTPPTPSSLHTSASTHSHHHPYLFRPSPARAHTSPYLHPATHTSSTATVIAPSSSTITLTPTASPLRPPKLHRLDGSIRSGMSTHSKSSSEHALSLGTASKQGTPKKRASSGQLLGTIGRGLGRMGSVMRRSSGSETPGSASPAKPDAIGCVTDASFSQHELHVSPSLEDLPPAWLDTLRQQGLTDSDLVLIAASRKKQRSTPLRAVHGSTPPLAASVPSSVGSSLDLRDAQANATGRGTGVVEITREGSRKWERKGRVTPGSSGRGGMLRKFSFEPDSPTTPIYPTSSASSSSTTNDDANAPPLRQTVPEEVTAPYESEAGDIPGNLGRWPRPSEGRKAKRLSDQIRTFSTFQPGGAVDDWANSLLTAYGRNPDADKSGDRTEKGKEERDLAAWRKRVAEEPEPLLTPTPATLASTSLSVEAHRQIIESPRSVSLRGLTSPPVSPIARWPRSPPPPPPPRKVSQPVIAPSPSPPSPPSPAIRTSSESFGVHYSSRSQSRSSVELDLVTPSTLNLETRHDREMLIDDAAETDSSEGFAGALFGFGPGRGGQNPGEPKKAPRGESRGSDDDEENHLGHRWRERVQPHTSFGPGQLGPPLELVHRPPPLEHRRLSSRSLPASASASTSEYDPLSRSSTPDNPLPTHPPTVQLSPSPSHKPHRHHLSPSSQISPGLASAVSRSSVLSSESSCHGSLHEATVQTAYRSLLRRVREEDSDTEGAKIGAGAEGREGDSQSEGGWSERGGAREGMDALGEAVGRIVIAGKMVEA